MAVTVNKKARMDMEGRTLIKWVKKAMSWCKTTFPSGVQKQEWSREKPINPKTIETTLQE